MALKREAACATCMHLSGTCGIGAVCLLDGCNCSEVFYFAVCFFLACYFSFPMKRLLEHTPSLPSVPVSWMLPELIKQSIFNSEC